FVPRWRPPFVSALAAEDRCHLNGLAVVGGKPRYVTALGETDAAGGWRTNKPRGGCLIDVPAGEVVARGLCMPDSPRWHAGRRWRRSSTCNSCPGCASPRWSGSRRRRSTTRSSSRPDRPAPERNALPGAAAWGTRACRVRPPRRKKAEQFLAHPPVLGWAMFRR